MAWSTRVTGRLSGARLCYDVTINATVRPDLDDAVRQALLDARLAVEQASGPDASVTGPFVVSSETHDASAEVLPGGSPASREYFHFRPSEVPRASAWGTSETSASPPAALPNVLLALHDAWAVALNCCGDNLNVHAHSHAARRLHESLRHGYAHDLALRVRRRAARRRLSPIPIVLSPSGGSAFTSELTLANLAPTDVQATFAYTPPFGGTPAPSPTHCLPRHKESSPTPWRT